MSFVFDSASLVEFEGSVLLVEVPYRGLIALEPATIVDVNDRVWLGDKWVSFHVLEKDRI